MLTSRKVEAERERERWSKWPAVARLAWEDVAELALPSADVAMRRLAEEGE